MNRTILIIVVVAFLVVGAIILFGQDRGDQEPAVGGEVATVTYNDSGYSPQSLRVKVGTTVTFKNESTTLMWTASAVHPVHAILPEFDPKKGVREGDSYSFTFTKTGDFGYHNHLKPGHTGTIIVE